MKKKFMYSAVFAVVLILLSFYVYKSIIYYTVPYNPIKEYASESLVGFHFTKHPDGGESVDVKCQDTNSCDEALKYLSELNLVPLKQKAALKRFSKQEDTTHFTGELEFDQHKVILISDILEGNPTFLHFSSNIPGFKGGYYKIEESKFDYDYIYNLINGNGN
ncbi:hypothetical protein AB1K89_07090 [Sporosarcina sp. 179-K 8C2 HS]|uniref:hypothetical protein n=1 Tax=Sporosarcina sp. 179-K 8C2 HS TaxID=3142387 RepID=UPI0039A37A61